MFDDWDEALCNVKLYTDSSMSTAISLTDKTTIAGSTSYIASVVNGFINDGIITKLYTGGPLTLTTTSYPSMWSDNWGQFD